MITTVQGYHSIQQLINYFRLSKELIIIIIIPKCNLEKHIVLKLMTFVYPNAKCSIHMKGMSRKSIMSLFNKGFEFYKSVYTVYTQSQQQLNYILILKTMFTETVVLLNRKQRF